MPPAIPPYVRTLFWDTNLDNFNPAEFPKYTIARILEYGERDAVAWMRQTFSEQDIVNVLRTARSLSRKSANFWALIFNIAREDVAALKVDS